MDKFINEIRIEFATEDDVYYVKMLYISGEIKEFHSVSLFEVPTQKQKCHMCDSIFDLNPILLL